MKRLRPVLCLLMLAVLSGCGGWQLRGAGGTALDGRVVVLMNPAQHPDLAREIERQLRLSGGRYAPTVAAADAALVIVREDQQRRALAVGTDARVQEYELNYRIEFALQSPEGESLGPSESVAAARAFRFNSQNVLGAESSEQALLRDLRQEAVRRLLARVGAVLGKAGG